MTAADTDHRPVEASHALESLTLTIKGAVADRGRKRRRARRRATSKSALKDRDKEDKGPHSVPVRIDARYVEMGKDRRGGGTYVLRYRWEGGGLFGGRSLRLTGFGAIVRYAAIRRKSPPPTRGGCDGDARSFIRRCQCSNTGPAGIS